MFFFKTLIFFCLYYATTASSSTATCKSCTTKTATVKSTSSLLESLLSALFLPITLIKRCPANEEFSRDKNRCQNTCDTYGSSNCVRYAEDGDCYCKGCLIRLTENGECVAPESSKCRLNMPATECPLNEILSNYRENGPERGTTCENYKIPGGITINMDVILDPRCVCVSGFLRLPSGRCTPIDDPQCVNLYKPSAAQCKLRGNEEYRSGTAPQKTCGDLGFPDPVITDPNVQDCYCKSGKIRWTTGGPCVAEAECKNAIPTRES